MLRLCLVLLLSNLCCRTFEIDDLLESRRQVNRNARILRMSPGTMDPAFTARQFMMYFYKQGITVLAVDDTPRSFKSALQFYKTIYELGSDLDVYLMKFGPEAVSEVLEKSKENPERFMTLLEEHVETGPSASSLGEPDELKRTLAFSALVELGTILPPISSIVIFTKRPAAGEHLARDISKEFYNNQIRVFVVWGGISENDANAHALKDLALETNGDFFVTPETPFAEAAYQSLGQNEEIFTSGSLLLFAKNLMCEQILEFPIDSDVTNIHIYVKPNLTLGVVATPIEFRGGSINLSDCKAVENFGPGSYVRTSGIGQHETHLDIARANMPMTILSGIWSLRVYSACVYEVTIFVQSKLKTNAVFAAKNTTGGIKTGINEQVIKLGVSGDFGNINSVAFVAKDGNTITKNVNFTLAILRDTQELAGYTEADNNTFPQEIAELDIDATQAPMEPFFAVVKGKDARGVDFTRMNLLRETYENPIFKMPLLSIEVGPGSELITQPNRQPQIFFEVTNNGNTAVLVRFNCVDERSLLLTMNPWYQWISPQETTTVRVGLTTTRVEAVQDTITFTAKGQEVARKLVVVDVGTIQKRDSYEPEITYKYTSDCRAVLIGDCHDATWTVEIKAKDTNSGLLQLSSTPRGLVFPTNFAAGTREQVTGYFSESCCHPDLQIHAIDRMNNRRTTKINAYRTNLSTGEIVAIVLGILIIILIVTLTILICRKWCCGKEAQSFDLPVYRAPARRSGTATTRH